VGVNSYWIEIEKFESESEKLMYKRLNRKRAKLEFMICVGVKVRVSGYRVKISLSKLYLNPVNL